MNTTDSLSRWAVDFITDHGEETSWLWQERRISDGSYEVVGVSGTMYARFTVTDNDIEEAKEIAARRVAEIHGATNL